MNHPAHSSPAPRVDVVMAAHNAAAFIGAAVSSALVQRGVDIEVYVADDGSIDDTAAIVASFDDPRVHLIAEGPFDTIAQARNRAASQGAAEWISYLDADDIWPQHRTATLSDYILDVAGYYHRPRQ
jgi:glycosyltransferase involved in cell wall biosynthesis